MTTKTIDLEVTPTSLDELLAILQQDSEVLLTKGDMPVARLSRVRSQPARKSGRIPGLHAGTTWVSDDFDEPLPDEFWLGES